MKKITDPLVSAKPINLPNINKLITRKITWSSSRPLPEPNNVPYQGSKPKYASVGKKLT